MSNPITGYLNTLLETREQTTARVDQLKLELDQEEKKLAQLETELIPDAMESLGLESFTTADGAYISVKQEVRAAVRTCGRRSGSKKCDCPECRRKTALAMEWLRSEGFGSLIKHEFVVDVPRGKDDAAETVRDLIQEMGLPYRDGETVPWQTLGKFARERLEEGETMPEELFSLHKTRRIKVG